MDELEKKIKAVLDREEKRIRESKKGETKIAKQKGSKVG